MQISHPANRLGLDYNAEARLLGDFTLIDCHMHLQSAGPARIYKRAADLYGVTLTYSMTPLEELNAVRDVMGSAIRFIAMPSFNEEERYYDDVAGYMEIIERYYAAGARIVKFWAAPRGIDIGRQAGIPDLLRLDSRRRREIMRHCAAMGMVFMTHVGDPDTWFAKRYRDQSVYGLKNDYYKGLDELLGEFEVPWIAAHMGGWPENLEFLSQLLERNSNLYLDTSATKWMVRELSRHSAADLSAFFRRWNGRIMFGSDIVVKAQDLIPNEQQKIDAGGAAQKACDLARQQAFELYASRYWALRKLFESDYDGESPIVDPDLLEPGADEHRVGHAPRLRGMALAGEVLSEIYRGTANRILERYYS